MDALTKNERLMFLENNLKIFELAQKKNPSQYLMRAIRIYREEIEYVKNN